MPAAAARIFTRLRAASVRSRRGFVTRFTITGYWKACKRNQFRFKVKRN